jgi:TRAP-type mannitol/chloroaromatic compound transport system permease large subunit
MKLMKWYPLLTLPMFIFMGYVLSESKIADDLYKMFHVWMGPVRRARHRHDRLMVLISAMNGLSVAGMAIGATIALPELLKARLRQAHGDGCDPGRVVAGHPGAAVGGAGALRDDRAPAGRPALARGVVPGLMMAAMFIALHRYPLPPEPGARPCAAAGRTRHPDGREAALLTAGLAADRHFRVHDGALRQRLDLAGGKLRHRRHGGVSRRRAQGPDDPEVFENSVRSTLGISCMFMWIILAALAFGAVFDGLGAVKAIESLFTEQLGLKPWMILILMQLSFILMGTFLDDTAMLVIVAPLYVPLVGALGFDLIWYGVLYTITTQIAYMTPPFGYNLFLMRAMAPPEIGLRDIYRSIVPFVWS